MPNLDYDPQNPSDLLGRPIKPGDLVAYSTTYGRSAGITVGTIVSINFFIENPYGPNQKLANSNLADGYTLTLQSVKTTAGYTNPTVYRPNGYIDPETGELALVYDKDGNPRLSPKTGKPMLSHVETVADRPRPTTIKHVKNVVLLSTPTEQELYS